VVKLNAPHLLSHSPRCQDHDYASAARLAFALKHPGRLLSVVQRTAGSIAVGVVQRTAGSIAVGGTAGQEARQLLSGLVRVRARECVCFFCGCICFFMC